MNATSRFKPILWSWVVLGMPWMALAEAPPAPSPVLPAPLPPLAFPASREAVLEERLRRMEQMNQRLINQVESLSRKVDGMSGKPATSTAPSSSSRDTSTGTGTSTNRSTPTETGPNARARSGIDAEGTDGRTYVREAASSTKNKTPAKVMFDEGIEFASDDDEFKLNFHNLTQAEYRASPSQDQGTLKDQFFVPRQRWYFTGQATKNVEFYTVINRGYGTLDLLDAFMTLNVSQSVSNRAAEEVGSGAQGESGRTSVNRARGTDPRVRFRVGRMKTPYLYEYFSIAEGDLIAPERSIYAGNLAGNRQNGAMLLGDILEDRVGYAAGMFNGPRHSFQDYNSEKDLYFSLNTRPFLHADSVPALKFFNIGGGVNGGLQNNPTQPSSFATANDETATQVASSLSPVFMAFNNDVREQGKRLQYAAHVAYFYKRFMLLAEYGGGTSGYGLNHTPHSSVQVPISGWMLQASYFLTGEQMTRRVNIIRPLHDFGYNDGKFGFGAVEVHARFSEMDVGNQVFAAGFVDPNLWTNKASATDIGLNWYLNYYTKVYLDWQHAFYGNPITTGASHQFMSTTDLFWLRFQIFF